MLKSDIVELLKTNDKAVARALVALNQRQTDTEQVSESTINRNGQGFRPCHARMGSSMAKFYQLRGYLTAKQIAYWRHTDKTGKMRIEIYAGQLSQVAAEKMRNKVAVQLGRAMAAGRNSDKVLVQELANSLISKQDLGNLLEERMHLELEYCDLLESDDESLYGPVKARLDQIAAELARRQTLVD